MSLDLFHIYEAVHAETVDDYRRVGVSQAGNFDPFIPEMRRVVANEGIAPWLIEDLRLPVGDRRPAKGWAVLLVEYLRTVDVVVLLFFGAEPAIPGVLVSEPRSGSRA